jgi:hypothetical protein
MGELDTTLHQAEGKQRKSRTTPPSASRLFHRSRSMPHSVASVGPDNQFGREQDGMVIKCMCCGLLCPSVSPDDLLPVQAPPPIGSILLFAPNSILFTHISQLVQVQNSQWNRPSVLRLTSFSAYCESRTRRSRKSRWDFRW